jgi:PKD repeat protein
MSKTITGPKECVEDLDAEVECTATDLSHCYHFACNINDECYTSCTASDAECASGYACSSAGTECLTDADGDGIADVEETVTECVSASDCSSYGTGYTCVSGVCTAPTTTSLCTDTDGGRDYTTQGTISGGLLYPTNNPIISLTDNCDEDPLGRLIEYYCSSTNSMIGYSYAYDCSNLGTDYICADGACVSSTTANQAPVAGCLVSSSGQVGIPITYSGESSSDADGDTLTYAWDFNEDSIVDSTSQKSSSTSSYIYTSAGTYTVTLTVTDEHGATDSCSQDIIISAATTETCADSDGGSYTLAGEVYVDGVYQGEDECDGNLVIEYSCDVNGIASHANYNCANLGDTYGCIAGACAEVCVDSDASASNPYTTYGHVAVNGVDYVEEDECDGNTLLESSCVDGDADIEEYDCTDLGDTYGCIAGACAEVCVDSDASASNPYQVKGFTFVNGVEVGEDECESSTTLVENYCSNGRHAYRKYSCLNGCALGKCKFTSSDGLGSGDSLGGKVDNLQYDESKLTDDYLLFKLVRYSTYIRMGFSNDEYQELTEESDYGITAYTTRHAKGVGQSYLDLSSWLYDPQYVSFNEISGQSLDHLQPTHWVVVKVRLKAEKPDDQQTILLKNTDDCGKQLYSLTTKDGEFHFKVSVDGVVKEVSAGPVNEGWQEVIGVNDGENLKLDVYDYNIWDGTTELVDTTTLVNSGGPIAPYTSITESPYNNNLIMGYNDLCEDYSFDGYLDDIYIYGE